MADEENKLTAKQEAFCNEYLVDLHITKAALRAGYSENTAYAIGSENLKKPEIQQRISQLRIETGKGYNITRERIAQELALIAFGDTKILFDETGALKSPQQWTDEGRIISSYEESLTEFGDDKTGGTKTTKKVKQWEKTKALEQLCRLMGFNEPDKMKHLFPEPIQLIFKKADEST
jgi:phage terminase small subunit